MPIRSLNSLGLLGISAVLVVAFFYQLLFGELPCPLCLLQRAAFVALGLGFLLNIRFGSSPAHYGLMLVSAVIGAGTALRQILLHILPGDPGYGSTFLGLHFYSWAFVAFGASILYAGTRAEVDRQVGGGQSLAFRLPGGGQSGVDVAGMRGGALRRQPDRIRLATFLGPAPIRAGARAWAPADKALEGVSWPGYFAVA
jgi:hypothetical protein